MVSRRGLSALAERAKSVREREAVRVVGNQARRAGHAVASKRKLAREVVGYAADDSHQDSTETDSLYRKGVSLLRNLERPSAAVNTVANDYAARVRDLPQVQKILLEKSGPEHRVYTVIQASPQDSDERVRLHQAELEALGDRSLLPLEFLVINGTTDEVRALPAEPTHVAKHARSQVKVLFDRKLLAAT